MQSVVSHGDGTFSIYFQRSLYRESAVKKACYKFAADCGALLRDADNDRLEVVLSFSADTSDEMTSKICRSLCNEVLDQDLREQIAEQTESTRNLILAQAFSRTSLLD